MPSSFFNRSPLKVVTPFKYSMGLFNIVESGLMEIVFTNIQCRPILFALPYRKNLCRMQRSGHLKFATVLHYFETALDYRIFFFRNLNWSGQNYIQVFLPVLPAQWLWIQVYPIIFLLLKIYVALLPQ